MPDNQKQNTKRYNKAAESFFFFFTRAEQAALWAGQLAAWWSDLQKL